MSIFTFEEDDPFDIPILSHPWETPKQDIVLTPDQSTAISLLLEFPPTFILQGYAGTGKTFLLKEFIKQASESYNVVLTATTHKAVGVASGDYTIHSYLGLTLDRKDDKYVLAERGGEKPVQDSDLVIIDEASMISSEVLSFILSAQEKYNLTLVFVGDPAQLPPVKELISPVWELDAPSFTLTEIVRQAADSNIIKLATLVRQGEYNRQTILDLSNGTDIQSGTIAQAQKFFLDHLCLAPVKTFPQILSFRNTVVNELNTWARRQVVGPTSEKYLSGEKLYIRTSYKDSPFKLEDIVTIESLEPAKYHPMRFDLPVQIVPLEVSLGNTKAKILVPLTPRDAANFTSNKNSLAKLCKKKQASWKQFWDYTESLIEVKHIYAMTTHRSQGSTFPVVIVNKTDINCDRLFYTAITRASKQLFIAL